MKNQPDGRYESTIKYIYSLLPMYQRVGGVAYKANLDNTILLDGFYNHPHQSFKTIHVAGTNGKGSVSHMLAAILQNGGYKTGLYTSPHYLDFRERIKVNGRCIDKDYIIGFIEKSTSILTQVEPSFFEMSVMMAFDYFRHSKVDVAVIEVGMGGRLDSTNIIIPELSIITNIGYDHQQFLGNTLPVIAKEKAGIMKPNVPVIIGETHPETTEVFLNTARKNKTSITFADQHFSLMYALLNKELNQHIHLKQGGQKLEIELDLFGSYQHKNLITTIASIKELTKTIPVSDNAMYDGLKTIRKTTGMIGRFEMLGTNPRFYCDAAHNAEGFREMLEQVKQIPYKELHLMLGFVKDKNVVPILKMIPENARCYFAQADIPRAMPANELASIANKNGLKGKVYHRSSEALKEVCVKASTDDLIMVTGSIFLVAEIIKSKKNIDSLCE